MKLTNRFDQVLQQLVAKRGVRHAVMAVESGDGSFRWSGAVGEATPDGSPMREETPFFIASITKLHIATIVMQLVEQRRITLDQPLDACLPGSLIAGIHRIGNVDSTSAITVRHLLSHTSGLPDWLEDRPKNGSSVLEELFRSGDRAFTLDDVIATARDLTAHFLPRPIDGVRVKARYSDTNFQLLIAIVETVMGTPLHRVFAERLYAPLSLRQTFHPGQLPLEAATPPAMIWIDGAPLARPLALQSLGDVYSTTGDLLTFMRALVRGEVFDDARTLDLMQEHWLPFGFPLDRAAFRSPGWPIAYGLGIMRFRLPRPLTPFWSMPPILGHTGSTGSWLFYAPAIDLFFCGTVDEASSGAVPYRVVPQLLRIMDEYNR
ncbi:MAG TPA: serine hydrolase domain-containing protein [Thermoanaerobaculia bacterium]